MFTSILCPVDFSAHAERALSYALDLAALTRSHLTLVHVVDPLMDAAAHARGQGGTLLAQTQQELRELLEKLAGHKGRSVEPLGIAVAVGDPADQILKQTTECGADLIVMGTQGLTGMSRFVFGSTTNKVLRESRVPVLAIPPPVNAAA